MKREVSNNIFVSTLRKARAVILMMRRKSISGTTSGAVCGVVHEQDECSIQEHDTAFKSER